MRRSCGRAAQLWGQIDGFCQKTVTRQNQGGAIKTERKMHAPLVDSPDPQGVHPTCHHWRDHPFEDSQ
jgi:hypothetical protein